MNQTNETKTSPPFQLGDKVRVKDGARGRALLAIPPGGWSGTIERIETGDAKTMCEIKWDNRTLAGMRYAVPEQSDGDGYAAERMWLDEKSLESDAGAAAPPERPAQIVQPALSAGSAHDTVRGIGHPGPAQTPSVRLVLFSATVGAVVGASIGAATSTLRGALLAATIGGVTEATIGILLLGRFGARFKANDPIRRVASTGARLGLVIGVIVGAFTGLAILALPWSLVGVVVGTIIGQFLVAGTPSRLLMGTVIGPACGILWAAHRQDADRAVMGALGGSLVGLVVGAGLLVALIAAAPALASAPGRHDRGDDDGNGNDELEE